MGKLANEIQDVIAKKQKEFLDANLRNNPNFDLTELKKLSADFVKAYEDYQKLSTDLNAKSQYDVARSIVNEFVRDTMKDGETFFQAQSRYLTEQKGSSSQDEIYQNYNTARVQYRGQLNEMLGDQENQRQIEIMYKTAMALQSNINNLLGMDLQMTIVTPKGAVVEYKDSDILSSLQYALGSDLSIVAKIPITKLKAKRDVFYGKGYNKEKKQFQRLYQEALRRYRIAKSVNSDMLLWRTNNKWDGQHVLNEGDLSEAYANLVYSFFKGSYTLSSDMEANIAELVTRSLQVDNMQGITRADYEVWNENTNSIIGRAIKSQGAEMPSYTRLYSAAKQILTKQRKGIATTITDKFINSSATTRDMASKKIEGEAEKLGQELANRILKK